MSTHVPVESPVAWTTVRLTGTAKPGWKQPAYGCTRGPVVKQLVDGCSLDPRPSETGSKEEASAICSLGRADRGGLGAGPDEKFFGNSSLGGAGGSGAIGGRCGCWLAGLRANWPGAWRGGCVGRVGAVFVVVAACCFFVLCVCVLGVAALCVCVCFWSSFPFVAVCGLAALVAVLCACVTCCLSPLGLCFGLVLVGISPFGFLSCSIFGGVQKLHFTLMPDGLRCVSPSFCHPSLRRTGILAQAQNFASLPALSSAFSSSCPLPS